MVRVPTLGEFREIDVLVETPASPYTIKIAVEAKDHHRKLNAARLQLCAALEAKRPTAARTETRPPGEGWRPLALQKILSILSA